MVINNIDISMEACIPVALHKKERIIIISKTLSRKVSSLGSHIVLPAPPVSYLSHIIPTPINVHTFLATHNFLTYFNSKRKADINTVINM